MRARRDQVQAYKFITRRIVAAMLSGEPETTERPMRRLGFSVFASSMVAVLGIAGFGVWGLVTGQTSDLEENTLVFEKGTHARYVYIDGRLHPVTNATSAYLILETSEPETRNLDSSALVGIERGPELGIIGAPDGLPKADDLLDLPWSICSVPPIGDSSVPETVMVVGTALPGGAPAADRGLYVTIGSAGYLLWNDRLLRLAHEVAPVALGLTAVQPTPIGPALANALTTGPHLDVLRPEGFGEETDIELGGRRSLVGFIYQAAGQHYVMTRDGLVPIGDFTLEFRLAIGAAEIRPITGAEASRALASSQPLEPEGYPLQRPELHPLSGRSPTICAVHSGAVDSGPAVTVDVFETAPDELSTAGSMVELRQSAFDDVAPADRMRLPSGRGALVQEASTSGQAVPGGTVYLVSPNGIKYPIGAGEVAMLGYAEAEPSPVPASLLALVPTGPSLTLEAARRLAQ